MFKDNRYITAGENEIYRYGHKARELAASYLQPNEQGFYSIPADGGKFYTIGTSEGKYGEYAKFKDQFLSVNKGGYVYAKKGSAKEQIFLDMVNNLILTMKQKDEERIRNDAAEEDEEE